MAYTNIDTARHLLTPVTLQATSADALAQWLAQVRLNARSTPVEARLTRIAAPAGVAWSGVLVMGLPER